MTFFCVFFFFFWWPCLNLYKISDSFFNSYPVLRFESSAVHPAKISSSYKYLPHLTHWWQVHRTASSAVSGCKPEGRPNIISSNILVVYSYGSESSLFALIYSWECREPSLKADITDVSLIVLPKFNLFLCEKAPSIEVVERSSISAASEAVDISLIALTRPDLSSPSGVRLPSLSSPRSSRRSRDRAFSRSREGVRDRSGFFRDSLLGESVTSKSLLEPDGDKESGNKGQLHIKERMFFSSNEVFLEENVTGGISAFWVT